MQQKQCTAQHQDQQLPHVTTPYLRLLYRMAYTVDQQQRILKLEKTEHLTVALFKVQQFHLHTSPCPTRATTSDVGSFVIGMITLVATLPHSHTRRHTRVTAHIIMSHNPAQPEPRFDPSIYYVYCVVRRFRAQGFSESHSVSLSVSRCRIGAAAAHGDHTPATTLRLRLPAPICRGARRRWLRARPLASR